MYLSWPKSLHHVALLTERLIIRGDKGYKHYASLGRENPLGPRSTLRIKIEMAFR